MVHDRIPGGKVFSFSNWKTLSHSLQAFIVSVENSEAVLIPDGLFVICFIFSFFPFSFQCSPFLELLVIGYLPVFLLFLFRIPSLCFLLYFLDCFSSFKISTEFSFL